jgi:hypothetical protein
MALIRKRTFIAESGLAHVLTIETGHKPGDYSAALDGVTVAALRAIKREGRTGYDVRTSGVTFSRYDGIDGALSALVSIGRVGDLGPKK